MEPSICVRMNSVLVTGASGGIGRAISGACCRAGLRVGAGYCKCDPGMAELEADPAGRVDPLRFDVRDRAAVEGAVASFTEAAGGIDALVCCAGVIRPGLLARADEEAIREQCDVNLLGTIFSVQAVLPSMMRRRSGCIVTVSSVAACRPGSGQAIYAATKAGVEAFTRSVAVEYASRGIRAYCLRLGPIDAPRWAHLPEPARVAAADRTFSGKPASPESVAGLVTYLLRDESGASSGATFDLDGGFLLA